MKLYKKFTGSLLYNGSTLWVTLYLVAQTLYWYQPWNSQLFRDVERITDGYITRYVTHKIPFTIESFDRVMGNATLTDTLISGRTTAATLTLLVLLPVLALFYWWLASLALGEKKNAPGVAHGPALQGFVSVISGMGLALLALRYAKNFGQEEDTWLDTDMAVPLTLVVCLLIWCGFRRALPAHIKTVSADNVVQALLCALPLTLAADLLSEIPLWTAAQYGIVGLVTTVVLMRSAIYQPAEYGDRRFTAAAQPLLFILPASLLYLELTNIANQYGIFINRHRRHIVIIFLVGLAISRVVSNRVESQAIKKILPPAKNWKTLWYPILLVTMACLACQPELQNLGDSDFFEKANAAVSISGFLNFGQIPSVETHAAHMGIDYLDGIFWGIINSDSLGACFTYYAGIPLALTTLIFYALLKSCIGEDGAFAAALLLPVTNIAPGDWYCHLSYIPALALLWLVRKRSFGRYAAFWGAAAFSVLYRGDIGLALGLAAVVIVFIDTAVQRSAKLWKSFLLALASVGGGLGSLLLIACLAKGIDPITRLREFLTVMAGSNQNWAYTSLGTVGTAGFAWIFLCVPVLILGLVLATGLRLARHRADMTDAHWLFFVFAGGYFLNFSRTLVRHSLAESIPVYCMAMGSWALALGIWLAWKDREPKARTGRVLLPMLLLAAILTAGAMFDGRIDAGTSLMRRAFDGHKEGAIVDYQRVSSNGEVTRQMYVHSKVQRVVMSDRMQNAYKELSKELDRLLEDDETWIDFTNESALYAILGRRSPGFVNQSPGMLSGEFSQLAYIEQIEAQADKVPVTLMPAADLSLGIYLDGVNNALRYYRVAEYIYQNYSPYETVGNFCIWLRKDVWEERVEQAAPVAEPVEINFSRLTAYNADLKQDGDGGFTMNATAIDPQIVGLEGTFKECRSGNLIIHISYTSDKSGYMQLFRAVTGRNYTEEDSTRVPIDATDTPQTASFALDWSTTDRLRLDTPDGSNVHILGISVSRGHAVQCGYQYGPAHLHEYPMGAIARLWGENDEGRAWENLELPGTVQKQGGGRFGIAEKGLGGDSGRYIKLVLTSTAETNATLSLTGKEHSKNYANFHFTVYEGTHTYLIRVSADSYWYSGLVEGINLAVNGAYTLDSIAMLDGD